MRSILFTILLGCVFLKTQPLFSNPFKFAFKNTHVYLNYDWPSHPNQVWLGYNFWCNSFLDWKVENGKAMAYPYLSNRRTAHVTSHSITKPNGELKVSGDIKLYEKVKKDTTAIYGFLIGAGDTTLDRKTNNFVFNTLSPGECHLIGFRSNGKIALINYQKDSVLFEWQLPDSLSHELYDTGLNIEINYLTDSATFIKIKGKAEHQFKLPQNYLIPTGNIALFYNSKTPFTENATFDNIKIKASIEIFELDQNNSISEVLNTFYTCTEDSLFLTAQLMPFIPSHLSDFNLRIMKDDREWKYKGVFDSTCFQIHYRISLPEKFKTAYYSVSSIGGVQSNNTYGYHNFGKIITKPTNKKPKLMALNCNGFTFFHSGGIDYENLFYPYRQIKAGLDEHKPDIVAFLGDQIYESRPQLAIYREPFAQLDYLYKWSIWCYAFRDITADQPTIIMTDDHDVYQGNIWGNGGVAAKTSAIDSIPSYYGKWNYDTWQQDNGGYFMSQDFVNMVTRSQTRHLPYPENPKLKNGMINYYTSYQYGNLNFAILEDKKFKSPPAENDFKIYNGFSLNPNTTAAEYHKDEFKLLGESQLQFLSNWSKAEKAKKETRVILTQSAYASLTSVQIDYSPLNDRPAKRDSTPQKVSPDMDTNGWPKIGRDRALESLNDSNLLFISGDQHMGAVIDVYDSTSTPFTFFSVPAIANTWPRMWWPNNDSLNTNYPLENYLDAFGNKMNVQAVANPNPLAPSPNSINYKSPGFGIIQFDKKGRKATLHAYPLYFNSNSKNTEFKGWPIEVNLKKK